MNTVTIPDEDTANPDALLIEFAERGNRVALLEEVYRRANNHPNGYAIAEDSGVAKDDIESIAEVAWKEFRNVNDDDSLSERLMLLDMSYGHVADHIFEQVDGAENPTN